MPSSNDIRLSWVLADPSTERAVDALGMGAQADKIANLLLPQLSVVTRRARYFSFLCWAVRKSGGNFTTIHRLEAELAIEEAQRHKRDTADACPNIVGRMSALRYLEDHNWNAPERPERLYKNTAFATYRPAMRALGLLTRRRIPELSEEGKRLATIYDRTRGRKPRCLGDISVEERGQLKKLIGLDGRQSSTRLSVAARYRRETYEEVKEVLNTENIASLLERYAIVKSGQSRVGGALHRAFVWELLSCGLLLAFKMLITEQRKGPVVLAFKRSLASGRQRPDLADIGTPDPDIDESAKDSVTLLRSAIKLDPKRLGLSEWPATLALQLLDKRDPDDFLEQLVARHCSAKPESPWARLAGDKVQILAPKKNLDLTVRPRTYRLDAFAQLLRDLRMIQ